MEKEFYMARFLVDNGDYSVIVDEIVVPIDQKEATKKGIEIFIKMIERRAKDKEIQIYPGRIRKFLRARNISIVNTVPDDFRVEYNDNIELNY